jgi:hypothetical protein
VGADTPCVGGYGAWVAAVVFPGERDAEGERSSPCAAGTGGTVTAADAAVRATI